MLRDLALAAHISEENAADFVDWFVDMELEREDDHSSDSFRKRRRSQAAAEEIASAAAAEEEAARLRAEAATARWGALAGGRRATDALTRLVAMQELERLEKEKAEAVRQARDRLQQSIAYMTQKKGRAIKSLAASVAEAIRHDATRVKSEAEKQESLLLLHRIHGGRYVPPLAQDARRPDEAATTSSSSPHILPRPSSSPDLVSLPWSSNADREWRRRETGLVRTTSNARFAAWQYRANHLRKDWDMVHPRRRPPSSSVDVSEDTYAAQVQFLRLPSRRPASAVGSTPGGASVSGTAPATGYPVRRAAVTSGSAQDAALNLILRRAGPDVREVVWSRGERRSGTGLRPRSALKQPEETVMRWGATAWGGSVGDS